MDGWMNKVSKTKTAITQSCSLKENSLHICQQEIIEPTKKAEVSIMCSVNLTHCIYSVLHLNPFQSNSHVISAPIHFLELMSPTVSDQKLMVQQVQFCIQQSVWLPMMALGFTYLCHTISPLCTVEQKHWLTSRKHFVISLTDSKLVRHAVDRFLGSTPNSSYSLYSIIGPDAEVWSLYLHNIKICLHSIYSETTKVNRGWDSFFDFDFLFCVHSRAKCYLPTHLCQPQPASCCPTLLLPWWTPFGLQPVHRCVCLLMRGTYCCAFNKCVHTNRCARVKDTVHIHRFFCTRAGCQCRSVCPACVFIGFSAIKHPDSCCSRGVTIQRWWEHKFLVLFYSDCCQDSYIFSLVFFSFVASNELGHY